MDAHPDFATLRLTGSGIARAPRIGDRYRAEGYLERFDAETLWLDAIWRDGRVTLIAPRLNNLQRTVARADFRLDGAPARPRFRRFYRHTLIEFKAPEPPARVSVKIGNWQGESVVHPADPAPFAGRNTLLTLSRNNDLAWIADWARYHVHHQGAEAALFLDNGSDGYGPQEITAALREGGLERAMVMRTPLPFGPRGVKPYVNAELFLQTGVMNAARLRFLGKARAVLNCDVDELVTSPGTSVFDMARRRAVGLVRFPGTWRYVPSGQERRPRHGDHLHARAAKAPCAPDWCIVPTGPFGGLQWRPHAPERLPLPRLFVTRKAWFYHCFAITDGWKRRTRDGAGAGTASDAATAEHMRAAGLSAKAGADE